MQFIPSFEDVIDEGLIIYCVIFSKPYNFPIARGFMNMYNYTCANMIETESWIIFYQCMDYMNDINKERISQGYREGMCTDEIILKDMKKIDAFKPKCMSFFDDKVTMIMFREPFWLL